VGRWPAEWNRRARALHLAQVGRAAVRGRGARRSRGGLRDGAFADL
jgi:hypothetical protein